METALPIDAVSRTIGADLRALRKGRGLTLTELALRLGRSVGWLSQVERGLSDPSISDLRNLAKVFEVSVSFFFANDDAPLDERGYVVRSDARRSLGDPAGGLTEEMLSPDLGGEFEMLRCVFAAGAELNPGDSFRFNREPYRWRNPGSVEAVVIWTITPPVY